METKHLDTEIETLNFLEITGDISDYGKNKLAEFKAIKQALALLSVGKSVKEKNIPNFEAWKELRYKRVNSEILECKGTHLWFEFREVYEKYKKEFDIKP